MRTVGQLLEGRTLVGRSDELATLSRVLDPSGPVVVFVVGPGGIGKSALVERFSHTARTAGATVVGLDCASIEPTSRGLLDALADAVGAEPALADLADRLASFGGPVVVALDPYERFLLVDSWIRRELVPALPEVVRLVVAGREPPATAWRASPVAGSPVLLVELAPLDPDAAARLLMGGGVPPNAVPPVVRFCRGHPLSLTIAATAAATHPELPADDIAVSAVVDELTGRYLSGVDPSTRAVLDAACLVRRTTRSLLRVLVPELAPRDAFERLAGLPFVTATSQGLVVHETLQHAVAAALDAADPARARRLRQAAWHQLRRELAEAPPPELWRYTADMLWLIRNPVVREAFFPSRQPALTVEPARAGDAPTITAIARRVETPSLAALVERWWGRRPDSFRVARDGTGRPRGLFWMLDRRDVPAAWLDEHPVTAAWADDLRGRPLEPGRRALLLFRWLDDDVGELPCPTQAAMWLDIKRTYVELRPRLDRLYTVVRDVEAYLPIVTPLGFRPLATGPVEVDGAPAHPVVLEFGPGSVDGWLARLAAAELGVGPAPGFDPRQRSVGRTDGGEVHLSRLESALLAHLLDRDGRSATRAELLAHVWGTTYTGGSNVVDSAVRALRRKLEGTTITVETVRGVGYRARAG
jgi:hypothetical protein